jgi:hypothetical protein
MVGGNLSNAVYWSDPQISFSVPPYPGAMGVKVKHNNLTSNEFPFLILNNDIDFHDAESSGLTSSQMAPVESYGQMAVCKSSNNIFVAWCGYPYYGIYLSKSDDNGDSFSTPVRIDTGNEQSDTRADSITMAANTNGIIALAWRDYRLPIPHSGELYLSLSKNNGVEFTECGILSSDELYVIRELPVISIETSGKGIKTFWREFKDGNPRIAMRRYNLDDNQFETEITAVPGTSLGYNAQPETLNWNNIDYVLWNNAGIYISDNSSGGIFSTPEKIDMSPVSEYIISKPDAIISNEHIFFTYADPRHAELPLSISSPRDIFIAEFAPSSAVTLREIQLSSGIETDFYYVNLLSSPDGSIYAAMLGHKFDGFTFDTILNAREIRDGILRNQVDVAEFDETYKSGGCSMAFDQFNRSIIFWDIRQFSEGAEIYIAHPN